MNFTDDRRVIRYFTQGQCNALAYEIYKLKEWTLAVVSDEPVGTDDYFGHVFIIDSDGFAIDINGRRPVDELRSEWPMMPLIHRFFDLAEFEHEMLCWENDTPYNKDPEAKLWARYIVDTLGS